MRPVKEDNLRREDEGKCRRKIGEENEELKDEYVDEVQEDRKTEIDEKKERKEDKEELEIERKKDYDRISVEEEKSKKKLYSIFNKGEIKIEKSTPMRNNGNFRSVDIREKLK